MYKRHWLIVYHQCTKIQKRVGITYQKQQVQSVIIKLTKRI